MITLRQERTSDYFETECVLREAFWNYYTPACSEHYLVHVMRGHDAFLPELDVVATDEGKIVGNVMYLKAHIEGDDGNRYEVLSLGPIGVLPEYQRQGIGRMLISHTREIAKKMGFRGILLCGDPDYYTNQGFVAAETFGIRNSENRYADALHACELYKNALASAKGCYFEDGIYQLEETLVQEYDKKFPPKEIVHGTPMQERFQMLVSQTKKVVSEVM